MFYNSRVYRMEGDAPEHRFEHLPGFPDLENNFTPGENKWTRYYGFGILAVVTT